MHLFGLVSYSLLLRKLLKNRLDPWTLATVMQTGIAIPAVFALPLYPLETSSYNASNFYMLPIISLLVVSLHTANVKSLQYLEAGFYSVLYNLRIIITTVLGVLFLGENIVLLQIFGGVLIFLAILTVKQKGHKELTSRGITWGIAASLIISVLNLFEKSLLNEVSYIEYAAPVMITSAIIMWIVFFIRRTQFSWKIFTFPIILLMIARTISAYSFTLAFNSGGKLSVSSYISSLSVILIVIFGAIILKERDFIYRKIVAILLATIGLTMILVTNL